MAQNDGAGSTAKGSLQREVGSEAMARSRLVRGADRAYNPQMRPLALILAAVCVLFAETPPVRKITFARVNPQPGQLSLFVAAADGSEEHPLLGDSGTDYDPA